MFFFNTCVLTLCLPLLVYYFLSKCREFFWRGD